MGRDTLIDELYEAVLDGMHFWYESQGTYSKIGYPSKAFFEKRFENVLDKHSEARYNT